jgi:hypothetical protein
LANARSEINARQKALEETQSEIERLLKQTDVSNEETIAALEKEKKRQEEIK